MRALRSLTSEFTGLRSFFAQAGWNDGLGLAARFNSPGRLP
jgi:hypothetical protein